MAAAAARGGVEDGMEAPLAGGEGVTSLFLGGRARVACCPRTLSASYSARSRRGQRIGTKMTTIRSLSPYAVRCRYTSALTSRAACDAAGIELVLLATPTTPTERMKEIAEASSGFVYLVSVAGVTGARTEVADRVGGLVTDLKGVTDKAVAVGFGVSEPQHAERIRNWGADGVIVGSALVKALGEAETPDAGLAALTEKMQSLSGVLR